jgi:hypothetical protein
MGTKVVVVGKKQHAGPNDRIFTCVAQSPSGAKFLCVVWHDPGDPDNEPTVTLWGPNFTEEDCWKQFRGMSKRGYKRKAGDWAGLPEASRGSIGDRILIGLDRLTAH